MNINNKFRERLKRILKRIPWRDDRELQLKMINNYITAHEDRKLQFGCGPNILNKWLNTDIYQTDQSVVYLDITKNLPIASGSFSYLTSEHLIEHITYDQGLFFLKECVRILKSKGKIRITTPDLAVILGLYGTNSEAGKNYVDHIVSQFLPGVHSNKEIFVINNAFRNWGHQFLYDKSTLTSTLENAGFIDIQYTKPGLSNDINFVDIDIREKSKWRKINEFEVIVVEATKP